MSDLLSANVLGDTLLSAGEGGWLDEWMFLYVDGSSDPDDPYDSYWYDKERDAWTLYGISYKDAKSANWGDEWLYVMERYGYTA